MMKIFTKKEILPISLIVLEILISVFLYSKLPSSIPSHWNIRGEIDAWTCKKFTVIFFPAFTIGIYLLMTFLPLIDPLKKNYFSFTKPYFWFKTLFVIFFVAIYIFSLWAAMGNEANINYFMIPAISILFIVMGIFLPQIKKNYFMGIKTPWTLESEEVWDRTHKLGGKCFIVGGIIFLSGLLIQDNGFTAVIIAISITALIPIIYSYLIFRKRRQCENQGQNNQPINNNINSEKNMECCKTENKCVISAFIIVLIVVFVSLAVWLNVDIKNKTEETKNTITVSDTGTIYTKPDLVITTVSVVTEDKTVAGAMMENTQKMNSIINATKALGVEEKDLKTIAFNVSPRYEWQEATLLYPSGVRTLVGYEITQSLQIKIRNLEKIGEIIQAATDSGANQVGDLQFTVEKEDELKVQARTEAIGKAKAKAKELAKELGIKLVRISSFSESGNIPYYYGYSEKAVPSGLGGGDIAQIQTGENKIEVTIYITYEIK